MSILQTEHRLFGGEKLDHFLGRPSPLSLLTSFSFDVILDHSTAELKTTPVHAKGDDRIPHVIVIIKS